MTDAEMNHGKERSESSWKWRLYCGGDREAQMGIGDHVVGKNHSGDGLGRSWY